jgi:hypothetical protein
MKKSKKVISKIVKFEGFSEIKMDKVLGGAINYNAAKSNTGNLAPGTGTATDGSTHG